MYLAREHTGETLPAIGARFAGRNHTTVLHACRRTAQRIAADPEAFDFVRRLTERLRPAVRGHTAPAVLSGMTDRLRGPVHQQCALSSRTLRPFRPLCTSQQPL